MVHKPGLQYLSTAFMAAIVALSSTCEMSPLQQVPPKMPEAAEGVTANAANGAVDRSQSPQSRQCDHCDAIRRSVEDV